MAKKTCPVWAVVSTTEKPGLTVRTLVNRANVCVAAVNVAAVNDASRDIEESWASFVDEYRDSVMYLSASWHSSSYEIATHLRNVSALSRKNLGYLVAIERGAEFIVDLDDAVELYSYSDVEPVADGCTPLHDIASGSRVWEVEGPTVAPQNWSRVAFANLMPYFDPQSDKGLLRPRGLPPDSLEGDVMIREMPPAKKRKRIAIVHSITDKRPDAVEAHITWFSKRDSCLALDNGVFTAWNAQSTAFSRDAFFALFLPANVAVPDVWRSYIASKLLWSTELGIAITAAETRDVRDSVDCPDAMFPLSPAEFTANEEATQRASNVLDYCLDGAKSIWAAMVKIIQKATPDDENLARAWIRDLDRIGYKWPRLVASRCRYSRAARQSLRACGPPAQAIISQYHYGPSNQFYQFGNHAENAARCNCVYVLSKFYASKKDERVPRYAPEDIFNIPFLQSKLNITTISVDTFERCKSNFRTVTAENWHRYPARRWTHELVPLGMAALRFSSTIVDIATRVLNQAAIRTNAFSTSSFIRARFHEDCDKRVCLSSRSIVAVLRDIAKENGQRTIYIATNTNIGEKRYYQETLRARFNISSFTSDFPPIKKVLASVDDFTLSVVEQHICYMADVFVGTAGSTWTGTVAMMRASENRDWHTFPRDDTLLYIGGQQHHQT
ncbi:hypothetical protein CTAYLR_007834 [Chrysophaeum taylorii]|uniref:Uncharacterized protein n=1 Tax=Chrysophaeum taylorii TaxID=2483200 RepID=A0AAD7XK36_9STRA|nr:hypothetical protein CTAYLR_007834 [Chrysophaeum taylorii]